MSVRAWLVDLDGTLYRPGPVKLAMGAELLACGLHAIPLIRTFRGAHERVRTELCEPISNPFYRQLEIAASVCGNSVNDLWEVVDEWMTLRPCKWIRIFRRRRLLAEIAAFRVAGGATALVSDYPAQAKLAALDAKILFDRVVAVGEDGGPGRLKPWPDGYLAAAERLGVAPEECLVIGDRPDLDGEAARRAGMAFRHVSSVLRLATFEK